jgi:hypothetical protein
MQRRAVLLGAKLCLYCVRWLAGRHGSEILKRQLARHDQIAGRQPAVDRKHHPGNS